MIDKIKKYIYQISKRDIYQVKVFARSKNENELFHFYTTVNVTKGYYPNRREVAKANGTHLYKSIKDIRKFHGAKIEVIIICKIGTFKRKDIL